MRRRTKTLALIFLATTIPAAASAELSTEEQRMIAWIDAHTDDAIALLEETVNIGSGTMNHDGFFEHIQHMVENLRVPRQMDESQV